MNSHILETGRGVASGASGASSDQLSGAALHKAVSFSGLTLDLEPAGAAATAGADAQAADATRTPECEGVPAESHGSVRRDSGKGSSPRLAGSSAASSHLTGEQASPAAGPILSGTDGIGIAGRLDLHLTWPSAAAQGSGAAPHASAALALQPLRVQLRQRHLVLLAGAAEALAAAFSQPGAPAAPPRCGSSEG